MAVPRNADEVVCRVCAETIKRAAKKCRFCGADLSTSATGVPALGTTAGESEIAPASTQPWVSPAPSDSERSRITQEPLRSSDMVKWILITFVGLAVIFALIEVVAA